jgi:DNA-directed RNA polymerase II subunit RPB2
MIAVHKTMDVPRHVLKTLFSDTAFPLIQHHVDSFNAMLDTGIPTFVKVSNPFELELGDKGAGKDARRFIRVYIGGKDGDKIRYAPPVEDEGVAIVPHACRLDNKTYALKMYADVTIEYEFSNGKKAERYFTDVFIGEIPLMLRSRLCYLTALDPYSIGECKFELGGYFIIDGAEKVLLTQEVLGNNMFYAGTRTRRARKGGLKTLVEKEEDALHPDFGDQSFEDVTESYTGIRTLSEDGARGPYSHFLVIPSATIDNDVDLESMRESLGRDRRLVTIQLPRYDQPVPVLSVFRALGVTSDRDLYDMVLAGVPDKSRGVYDQLFQEIVLSHERALATNETTDIQALSDFTRSKSRYEVVASLHDTLFSNVEGSNDDTGGLFRRKAYMLAHMLKMAMDVSLGLKPPSDRDNMQYKRLQTSGDLCFEEFRRIYREVGKSMSLAMDSRVQYESSTYSGEKLANLVDSMGFYWKGYRMLNEYSKSFKGQWGGRVGIAQELARPSYAAVIHHLRKTDLQIDKSISTAPPRRLFASQFGIMCPVDSPDGSDIGYKKALTILAQVSTAVPSTVLLEALKSSGIFRETADIHPSTWRPEWTRIYLNSVLAGACIGNTEELHRQLRTQRRAGKFGNAVSLAWMRINNEYRIYSDAGRPIRPVYREGVTPAAVLKAKSWKDILTHIDYIDAVESDSLRISMEPYHPTQPSEIHMSFCMSALANLVPYPDHNPGPRNAFSIAQQKQAASWFHTNYQKRFDTIAMLAVTPQKPLSQTWIYHEIMGRGGCMAYGENAIVAITMYGGHNQEDSMILNGAALKRGMYKTMYYHSYDHAEEMLDIAAQTHTKISNPTKNAAIKRKEGKDYEQLDADGIIKVGSVIDENTIMVGMVAPIMSPTGQVTGHRDVSISAKVGHHGRVDAVYQYSTGAGLMGVKIRLIEERTPEIGDKMASRHSQKGTVGMILDEEDMPFSASGLRPDLIFNPHGIPTRMTVGQFLEAGSNKLGLKIGSFIDATPFTQTNRIGELRKSLLENGYEPYGSEVLYNGQTGEMMNADIFMGPIYYQRLKHMVADKINSRDTGPKKLMTKQPTQGRGDEGGLRIGEMERDALISHGMSKFLTESMMERSDKATVQFDKENGRFDTSRDLLDIPYSMALFTQELESMHVTLHLESS